MKGLGRAPTQHTRSPSIKQPPPTTPKEAGDEVIHGTFRATQGSLHSNTKVHTVPQWED